MGPIEATSGSHERPRLVHIGSEILKILYRLFEAKSYLHYGRSGLNGLENTDFAKEHMSGPLVDR